MSQPTLPQLRPRKGTRKAPLYFSNRDAVENRTLPSPSSSAPIHATQPTSNRPDGRGSITPASCPKIGPQSVQRISTRNDHLKTEVHLSTSESPARQLLTEFIATWLGIDGLFIGFQSRFKHGSDLILFRGPRTGSTLAVECDLMLQPRSVALEIIQSKIRANVESFTTGVAR